jgi:hypothetical protein
MHDSSFGRLIGALLAPGKTFQSIAERPTWVVALVLFLVIILAVTIVTFQRVDLNEMMRQQMAERGQEMPPEMEQVGGFMTGCYIAAGLGFWIGLIFVGAAYFLLLNLAFGGQLRYVTSLSVLIHALMPFAVAGLLSVPILLSRETLSMEELQSGSVLPSSLAVFAPEEAGPRLIALLSSLDFFTLWTVVLLVIGYSLAARVSKTSAAVLVVVVWILLILLRVGLAGFAPGGAR